MDNIKTIIFDFDGVIADTIPYTLEKTVAILKNDFSVKRPANEIVDIIRSRSFREIIKELKIPLFKLPFIVSKINESQEELNKIIDTIKVIPGIKALLNNLKDRGFDLVVISSNIEKNVKEFLRINGIKTFSYIDCGSHILGKSGAIKNFLKSKNLKNSEVIYVGDEIRDIEASHKVGIKIISVAWGLDTENTLQRYGADFIAKNPRDILKIIGK